MFDSGFAPATLTPPSGPLLGSTVDPEYPIVHDAAAESDDQGGVDDEDAVDTPATLGVWQRGAPYLQQISCVGTAPISAWVDFNRNGTFDDGERASSRCDGDSATLAWTVPDDVVAGPSYLRIRTASSADDISSPTGLASDGEVEDHALTIQDEGSITIVKHAAPADGTDFSFSATGAGLSPFSLDVDDDPTLADTRTFSGLVPGRYSVTEGEHDKWLLDTLECDDADGESVTDVASRTASIDLAAGAHVTCTFTNAKPSIALVKKVASIDDVDGDGATDAGDRIHYAFTVTNTGPVALTDVSVTDPLPGVEVAGGPLASLAPGDSDSTTFTATYVITKDDVKVGGVTNQATATGTPPSGPPVTDLSDAKAITGDTPTFTPTSESATVVLPKEVDRPKAATPTNPSPPPAAPAAPQDAPSGPLAFTGANLIPLLALGAASVLGGLLLVGRSRRRRLLG
jgi:hypothetical protein